MATTTKFNVNDKVKLKAAINPEHVGKVGVITEVVGDLCSVRLKAASGLDHEFDTLGCVPLAALEK